MKRRSAKVASKKATNVQARYDAAGSGRRLSGWKAPSTGPNRAIVGTEKVRDRSRDAVRNDWSGASAVQHWTTNLIGTGIIPRLPKSVSKPLKKKFGKLWKSFVSECDADWVLDYYGMQTLSTRSWLESGEGFIRARARRFDSGLTVPLQFQIIESDFCPRFDADAWPGMTYGNKIRQGIELNRIGKRVAYWFYKEHPGDFSSTGIDMSRLVRVPADQVSHMFEPKRPGQLRGVSELAPILTRLRNALDLDDAVLERQKLANLFTAFVTKNINTLPEDELDPVTGLPIAWDNDGGPMAAMSPGTVQALLPGEDVKFANPPEAGTTYSEYMRNLNMGTAAGQGLPYEIFSGDIKEVSDRTLRVVINEFRRFAEQRQWQIIIPKFCQFTFKTFVEFSTLAGHFSVSEASELLGVEWAPQGWAYIHPVQDVQGKKIEVEAGFRSRSSVIASNGDDPDVVDEERAEDHRRELELDLVEDVTDNADGGDVEEDGIDDNEYPPTPSALEVAQIERVRAETRLIDARTQDALVNRPDPKAALAERILNIMEGQRGG